MPTPVSPLGRWLATVCALTLAAAALHAQQTERAPRLAAATPPLLSQRAKLEKIIHQKVLPNGLEVIVVENHGVPLATVEIDVRNGSFTQTPEYEGLAHMYEHMFFKANKRLPGARAVRRIARPSWARCSTGRRSEEVVNYYLTLPADSLDAAA